VKELKGTSWGCSKKAQLPLQENNLLRVECTDRIQEVGQPNGEWHQQKVRMVMFNNAKEPVVDG